MPRKNDTNPLLPFTYVDLMYIITGEKKKASDVAANSAGGNMHRRGNAECTLTSHSSVPAAQTEREHSMNLRQQKAVELADRDRVIRNGDKWLVFSLNGPQRYIVTLSPLFCSCPDFETRHADCKHIMAVRIVVARKETRGVEADLSVPPVVWPRKTYQQDWPNYDLAQQNEQAEFRRLLADLCSNLPEPASQKGTKGGRPTAPLSDLIFASIFKIYSGMSGRRFATDLREAQERGHVSQTVHHSTIARCLEDAQTTPILERLIEASSLPFKAIETEFAVDSSGVSSCKFDRWYEEKWGRTKSEHSWVKVHAIVGTTTHVVASVIITDKYSHDAPMFPPLVKAAAKNFTVNQVSGDKAYTTTENFQVVEDCGGTGYLSFKSNATGSIGGIYERMYHLFCLNKEEYLDHYHRRSNVESLFSAVKRLFGDSVRSKNDIAQKNETLGKLLAYNITLLVHAIYELGLEPRLGREDSSEIPAILPFVHGA